jgi:L-seryl-tRNA(Ser) seleniumtransferase
MVKLVLRQSLDRWRTRLVASEIDPPAVEVLAAEVGSALGRIQDPDGRKAINATGILLHTGLGRAPFCREAVDALGVADGYSVLQTSLEDGKRSLREEKIEAMLQALTGCEAATVVNNNAAATMLALNTLASGREVIISRGQLIEIGGAFRIPEVLEMSGAGLCEIGCTNRTHLRDYEAAIGEETGAIIHVHTSNYRVRGFAGTPPIEPLAALGRERGLPVIDDLGSGALVPLAEWGLPDEPLVSASVKAGATLACFSGDKLISGPQCGILVGSREVIQRVRKNPFARMFRVCKLTLAALESTLTHFVNGTFREGIPFYRMLSQELPTLEARARALGEGLPDGVDWQVVEECSYVGSGSLPDMGVPTQVLQLSSPTLSAEALASRLRLSRPSTFVRIKDQSLLLDLRTVAPTEDTLLSANLQQALTQS